MNNLKDILTELQNCVRNDEYDMDLPLVWSKDFTKQLARDADNYKTSQRRVSSVGDMDFPDEEDDYIRVPYQDNQDELDQAEITYNADTDSDFDQNWLFAEEEESQFKTNWGAAYKKYLAHGSEYEENEEKKAAGFSPDHMKSEYDDDCPDCFGTGADFPRLKGDCKSCKGSGKVAEEEEEETPSCINCGSTLLRTEHTHRGTEYTCDECNHVWTDESKEEEQEFGGNEQEARRVRDKAVSVRDEALGARDRAKKQNADERDPTNQAVDDQYGLDDPNDDEDFGGAEGKMGGDQEEWDDPDFQGVIRRVDNAHLVFKRQQEDGTFNELWQYNLGDDFKKELAIRRAILAGTDIPINKMRSPDNDQSYELWTVGNGQLLQVKGLPN